MSTAEILPIRLEVVHERSVPSIEFFCWNHSSFADSLRTVSRANGTGTIGIEFDILDDILIRLTRWKMSGEW